MSILSEIYGELLLALLILLALISPLGWFLMGLFGVFITPILIPLSWLYATQNRIREHVRRRRRVGQPPVQTD